MAIDPKKAGQCWSCKYCEDIGTHTYEEYVTYIRQCNKSGHDYVDKCEHRCSDYEWDHTHKEFWRTEADTSTAQPTSPAFTPIHDKPKSSKKPVSPALIRTIVILIAALVLICVSLFLILQNREPAPEEIPGVSETTLPTETDPTVPTEDYSLAGEKRVVKTESGDGLNLREDPRADAVVITAIPDGRTVTIEKAVDNWAYVTCEGETGWCNMDYLITEEEFAKVKDAYLNITAVVATESSPLRLRETPSTNGKPIDSMPKGSQILVLKLEGSWAFVEYKGIQGWCAVAYLDMDANG